MLASVSPYSPRPGRPHPCSPSASRASRSPCGPAPTGHRGICCAGSSASVVPAAIVTGVAATSIYTLLPVRRSGWPRATSLRRGAVVGIHRGRHHLERLRQRSRDDRRADGDVAVHLLRRLPLPHRAADLVLLRLGAGEPGQAAGVARRRPFVTYLVVLRTQNRELLRAAHPWGPELIVLAAVPPVWFFACGPSGAGGAGSTASLGLG